MHGCCVCVDWYWSVIILNKLIQLLLARTGGGPTSSCWKPPLCVQCARWYSDKNCRYTLLHFMYRIINLWTPCVILDKNHPIWSVYCVRGQTAYLLTIRFCAFVFAFCPTDFHLSRNKGPPSCILPLVRSLQWKTCWSKQNCTGISLQIKSLTCNYRNQRSYLYETLFPN